MLFFKFRGEIIVIFNRGDTNVLYNLLSEDVVDARTRLSLATMLSTPMIY